MTLYKLSPSQLTFAWDECPRCFYLDVVMGIKRPATAFPKVFSRIDSLMKHLFEGKSTQVISPELPPGKVTLQGKWVNSAPIQFEGIEASCYLKGAFDSVLTFEDGTYAVIDFKTSSPRSIRSRNSALMDFSSVVNDAHSGSSAVFQSAVTVEFPAWNS